MKKAEYIEKYGEEAWKIKAQKDRERISKWREDNKDRIKDTVKKYYESHKETIKEYYKTWANDNRERINDNRKKILSLHPERRKKYNSKWKQNNPKISRAHNLVWGYNQSDKEKMDIKNNVSSKWIVENIFSGQKCVYCGDQDWTHLGCDRIDNSKPHTADNVVCSCGLCNIEKGDRYTVEEFKQYRSLHPRACDIPKAPAIQLSETGALKKRAVQIG